MNNEEIKQGRDNYIELLKKDIYYEDLEREFNNLKENPYVKRYFELSDKLSRYKRQNNDTIEVRAFDSIARDTKDSKKIYMFMGFFDKDGEYTIDKDKIVEALFMDIETMDGFKIPYKEYEDFKQKNNTIYAVDEYELKDILFYADALSNFRNRYLSSLVKLNQEDAMEELMKSL